ncbi:MAG: hypothetical protein LBS24_01115 [Clostridiales Family XIII bacterium]|jgi:hypothetical protein|nr:hypothetical protein [Clostridiales Family XIII bacterium]
MSGTKYFYLAEKKEGRDESATREEARNRFLSFNGSDLGGAAWGGASWYRRPFKDAGLIRHKADKLLFFIGSDPTDAENLHAEFRLRIENDLLTLTHTCVVFIPAGVAHGELEAVRADRPVFAYNSLIGAGVYSEEAAEAVAPAGRYAHQVVERYEPLNGKLPDAPAGFLTLLLWLDGKKLPGAPYTEAVWFNQCNDTGPAPHAHEFDEFIGFIGSDPAHPEELNAELQFYIDDEAVTITKSCLVFIPRGVRHSPILVPRMERPLIHFSGGVGGAYERVGAIENTNIFKPGTV